MNCGLNLRMLHVQNYTVDFGNKYNQILSVIIYKYPL